MGSADHMKENPPVSVSHRASSDASSSLIAVFGTLQNCPIGQLIKVGTIAKKDSDL